MLAGRPLDAVISVPVETTQLLCTSGRPEDDDRVLVRLLDEDTQAVVEWGLASVTGVILASMPPHETVTLRKVDCVATPPPHHEYACITYEPVRAQPLSTLMPRRLINLDEMEAALAHRLRQYQQPTLACVPTTDDEVRLDRMSYTLACAAMARNAHHDRLLSNAEHRGSTTWRLGEHSIACFRLAQPGAAEALVPHILGATATGRVKSRTLVDFEAEHATRVAHIAQLRAAGEATSSHEARATARSALKQAKKQLKALMERATAAMHPSSEAMFGVDALDYATLLLPFANLDSFARLERGKIYARTPLLALAAAKRLDSISQFNLHHGAQPEQLSQHPGIAELMDAFHHEVRNLSVVVHPDRLGRRPRRTYDRFAPSKYIVPVVDVDDLVRVMPACMRIQAERAFHPDDTESRQHADARATDKTQTRNHLRFADRSIFFRFVLANGMSPEVFDAAITAPWEGDAKYQDELRREIKGTAKFIATHGSASDYNGDSCKKLQLDGYCPFFSGDAGKARIACYHNQGALLMRPTNPPGWSIGFPLIFSQQVKRALLLARDASSPSPSSSSA